MARKIISDADDQIVVQGFREGGGEGKYVYFAVLDDKEAIVAEWTVSTEDANILAEFIRQEAEFATQPAGQEEGNK